MTDTMPLQPKLQRKRQLVRDAKILFDVLAAAADPDRPLVTHLVITRRCNLSCGYCFEYDKVSQPVPLAELKARIDHLAKLKSIFVTLTGGESLLHPDAVELVRYVNDKGMVPFLNTNGYLLTKKIIEDLNDAGLYGLQLSIDNAKPNDVSKKSLKPLMPKLRLLAMHAKFHVRINTVLGSSPPAEALDVAKTVVAFGFDSNCSLVRDETGALIDPDPETRAAYDEIRSLGRRLPSFLDDDYTRKLLDNGTMDWKCRAGARTFLVDEHGKVHLCQPRMESGGGVPLLEYTALHIRAAFHSPKPCASKCPIAYAHHASKLDGWRSQKGAPLLLPAPSTSLPSLPAASKGVRSARLSVLAS
ncbi:MAG: radical SAM protein [Kofleriaceae bacterium]